MELLEARFEEGEDNRNFIIWAQGEYGVRGLSVPPETELTRNPMQP